MTEICWPKGRRAFLRQLPQLRASLGTGQAVLAIDPALGRGASKPAFALLRDGAIIDKGIFKTRGGSTQDALDSLYWAVRSYVEEHLDEPFVLVIEELRGKMVHAHLHWAAGAIIAGANPSLLVELPICYWKAHAATDSKYRKGDIADAVQFAKTIVALCATDESSLRRKRTSKKRRKRR